ncbi:HlyD family secretion protein [Neotabrizicola sp. VNH66]|uniref:HlyD family secretion protein n=1 Tax=Neotabrizicola sp. VNH66 TaxID=3400918 RepID=UPI003C073F82
MSDIPELPAAPAAAAPAVAAPAAAAPARKSPRRLALILAVPLALAAGAGYLWFAGGGSESTENAQLRQARLSIAPTIGGRVVEVAVTELQHVKAGDLLFRVDPEPYQLAVTQAEAAVAAARLQVEQLKAAYAQALAQEKLTADNAAYLRHESDRKEALAKRGVAAVTDLDDARHAALQAEEQSAVAAMTAGAARAALGGDPDAATDSHPAVAAALAELDRARYNLSVTTVTAPADGIVTQAASFRPGAMVAAGTAVFALVETGEVWVEANFKETQLADMAAGQRAEITFDALPGQPLHGTVEAIGAGTGAEFSLLPAQNATGNWVKVTQRVPVRIRLDDPARVSGLATGLSAEVTVETGQDAGIMAAMAAE